MPTPAIRAYHGSRSRIERFDYAFTNRGNDQLGSGFYFTTDPAFALTFCQESRDASRRGSDPHVMVADLGIQNPLQRGRRGAITPDVVHRILSRAPALDEALENWGHVECEGREAVLGKAVRNSAVKDADLLTAFNQMANDFFGDDIEAFNTAIRDVLGYDGVVDHFPDGSSHYAAWFPDQVFIVERLTPSQMEARLSAPELG